MFDIAYTGIDDSLWNLDGRGAGLQGVFTSSVEGLVAAGEAATTPGPGRIGARTTGRPSVPPFEGVLNVVISSRSAEHLPELPQILSAFRRAWSTLADGRLELESAWGARLHTRARLSDRLAFPTASPFDRRTAWLELAISVECRDGVWFGAPETITDGLVVNSGELTAWPKVRWTGTGTVTAPGAAPLELPATPVEAVMDCDPATGMVITVDGEPAPELWSQLRGRTFPRGVSPGGADQWQFSSGVVATVTPRLLDPWRW